MNHYKILLKTKINIYNYKNNGKNNIKYKIFIKVIELLLNKTSII